MTGERKAIRRRCSDAGALDALDTAGTADAREQGTADKIEEDSLNRGQEGSDDEAQSAQLKSVLDVPEDWFEILKRRLSCWTLCDLLWG